MSLLFTMSRWANLLVLCCVIFALSNVLTQESGDYSDYDDEEDDDLTIDKEKQRIDTTSKKTKDEWSLWDDDFGSDDVDKNKFVEKTTVTQSVGTKSWLDSLFDYDLDLVADVQSTGKKSSDGGHWLDDLAEETLDQEFEIKIDNPYDDQGAFSAGSPGLAPIPDKGKPRKPPRLNFTLNRSFIGKNYSMIFLPPMMPKLYQTLVWPIYFFFVSNDSLWAEIKFESADENLFTIHGNDTFVIENAMSPYYEPKNVSVFLEGHFLAKTWMHVEVTRCVDQKIRTACRTERLENVYRIHVRRMPRLIDYIFVYVIWIMIVINSVGFGCTIHLDVIWEIMKRPLAPVVGFCCQFVFMPVIAFCLTRIPFFDLTANLSLGLFTNGCSPGGGSSNYWTLLFDGHVDLSITMTFVSTIAALVMMPLWLFTLGKTFTNEAAITIPYQKLVVTLATFVLPLGLGILVKRYKPTWAKMFVKALKILVFIMVLFIFTAGIYCNLYVFKMLTGKLLFVALLIPILGMLFGGVTAKLFRFTAPQTIAIALETGIQNTGVAVVVLRRSLPQPDADISSVVPIAASILAPIPLFILLGVYIVAKKFDIVNFKVQVEKELAENEKTKNGIPGSTNNMVVAEKYLPANEKVKPSEVETIMI